MTDLGRFPFRKKRPDTGGVENPPAVKSPWGLLFSSPSSFVSSAGHRRFAFECPALLKSYRGHAEVYGEEADAEEEEGKTRHAEDRGGIGEGELEHCRKRAERVCTDTRWLNLAPCTTSSRRIFSRAEKKKRTLGGDASDSETLVRGRTCCNA